MRSITLHVALWVTLTAMAAVTWSEPIPLQNADFRQVADGRPVGWTLSTWYKCPVPLVSAAPDDQPPHVRLDFPADAEVYTVAFHQTLPDLPRRSTATIRFRYRATFAAARQLSVAVSASAGCNVPCNRVWYYPVADGTWHDGQISMPLRRVNQVGSALEFTFNGPFGKGDHFSLATVSMDAAPPPLLALGFTDPPSGVVFTDAPTQVLRVRLTPAAQAAGQTARCQLLSATTGAVLQTRETAARPEPIPVVFDLARQPLGRYRVVATLVAADGTETARQELTAWRVAPTADTTRVVNGRVVRGNKPMVLFGTYHVSQNALDSTNRENQRLGLPALGREAMLRGLTQAGIQTAFYSWGIPAAEYLKDVAATRQTVIPECAGMGTDWAGKPLEEQVAPFADDPRVFAWGGWDEPSETTIDRAITVYRGLKSVSPRRLVVNTFNQVDVADLLEGTMLSADLMLADVYDIRGPDSDLSRVGTAVAHLAAYARQHPGIAVGVTPQAFIYFGPEPTPEQLRVQIYLGLVNGATAFFPYAYVEDYNERPFAGHDGQPSGMSGSPGRQRWWLPDSALWALLPRLRRELDALAPVILRGQTVPVQSDGGPVQWLASRADGQLFFIAANPQAQTNQAVFHFPQALGRLSPRFGTPAADVHANALTLTFEPYEVKVFRVREASPRG